MKFRIVDYYGRYKPQVSIEEDKYTDIGSPTGYYDIEAARQHCKFFKENVEHKIIEEFEL